MISIFPKGAGILFISSNSFHAFTISHLLLYTLAIL